MERTRDVADIIGELVGGTVSIAGFLAAQLVREGIADREKMVKTLEEMAGRGDPLSMYSNLAALIEQMRPWEVIEGGKPDDDDPDAA